MALASLMVVEQSVLASWVEWVQTALASLMDSVVLESFWQRAIPSSQTNFHQQALLDDLVVSNPPRALLASSQRWPTSAEGAPLLSPGILAVGEGAAGISSREASPISASSGALTWDDVSTGPGKFPSLVGGGARRTMGFSLFGVEFSDMCPDMSNLTWDRSSLISMVMLTSLSTFGRVALMGLAIRMEEQSPEGGTFSCDPSSVDCGMSTIR